MRATGDPLPQPSTLNPNPPNHLSPHYVDVDVDADVDALLCSARERFPLVERAVADVPALADPEFASGIRGHAENLLKRSRGVVIPAAAAGGGGGGGGGGGNPGTSRSGLPLITCPPPLPLRVVTDCVVFIYFFSPPAGLLPRLGADGEDGSRLRRNSGARDDAGASGERRNGASLREDGPHRDEGMEISDG